MAYQKPYTFRAGTYAKAAEVNANFDTLKDFVNELLTTFQEKIVGLQVYNKANKEGDATQIFKAAQGTNANDVVINGQLTTIDSRITTLEQAGNWVPPDYTRYQDIDNSGTFTNDGVLYVYNGHSSYQNVVLGGNSISIQPNNNATFPIKAGTTYMIGGYMTIKRFFY